MQACEQTNYRPEELTAVAAIILPPLFLIFLSLLHILRLLWGRSQKGVSHRVLLPWGVITSLWNSHTDTQPVYLYLSLCHYSLQLSPWLSFRDSMHIHINTHTRSSNPNVPSIFVITCSPTGTRPIGWFCFLYNRASRIEREHKETALYLQQVFFVFVFVFFSGQIHHKAELLVPPVSLYPCGRHSGVFPSLHGTPLSSPHHSLLI